MLNTAGLSWGGEAEEGDSTSAAATAQVRTTLSHAPPPPHKLSLLHMPPPRSLLPPLCLLKVEEGREGGRGALVLALRTTLLGHSLSICSETEPFFLLLFLPPFALSFSTLPFCSFPYASVKKKNPFPNSLLPTFPPSPPPPPPCLFTSSSSSSMLMAVKAAAFSREKREGDHRIGICPAVQ